MAGETLVRMREEFETHANIAMVWICCVMMVLCLFVSEQRVDIKYQFFLCERYSIQQNRF